MHDQENTEQYCIIHHHKGTSTKKSINCYCVFTADIRVLKLKSLETTRETNYSIQSTEIIAENLSTQKIIFYRTFVLYC